MQEKWTYGLWGAGIGAAALAAVGFTWGGWVTSGGAETMTLKRSQAAVVAVLTPVCIEKFQGQCKCFGKSRGAEEHQLFLDAAGLHCEGGWATFGQDRPFELADACAEALNRLSILVAAQDPMSHASKGSVFIWAPQGQPSLIVHAHRLLPKDRPKRPTDDRRCPACIPIPMWR